MTAVRTTLWVLAGLFAAVVPATAREEILQYYSKIAIYETGNAVFSETIEVRSEGTAIKHGIYVDIDTGPNGTLQVLSVRRDGAVSPYTVENPTGTPRVKMGDADVLLPPGRHVYEIGYTITNVVEKDRFAWDVTGKWGFPILSAIASVVAPGMMTVTGANAVIDCKGCATKAASSHTMAMATFAASGPLDPGQSMKVVVEFERVAAPITKLDR